MLKRLRQVLVESFVGAIALGWMLAEVVTHFVNIFAAPVGSWLARNEYGGIIPGKNGVETGFLLQDALPELIRSIALLFVWYFLVRWLYFTPARKAGSEPAQNTEQPV